MRGLQAFERLLFDRADSVASRAFCDGCAVYKDGGQKGWLDYFAHATSASERPVIVDFAEPPQRPDLIKRVEGSLHVEARKLMNNKRRSCLLSCRANLDITAP